MCRAAHCNKLSLPEGAWAAVASQAHLTEPTANGFYTYAPHMGRSAEGFQPAMGTFQTGLQKGLYNTGHSQVLFSETPIGETWES